MPIGICHTQVWLGFTHRHSAVASGGKVCVTVAGWNFRFPRLRGTVGNKVLYIDLFDIRGNDILFFFSVFCHCHLLCSSNSCTTVLVRLVPSDNGRTAPLLSLDWSDNVSSIRAQLSSCFLPSASSRRNALALLEVAGRLVVITACQDAVVASAVLTFSLGWEDS